MAIKRRKALLLVAVSVAATSSLADAPALHAAEPAVGPVLARFTAGDPGWKARMRSLVELAKTGPAAVPALVEQLKAGSPTAREFAAQALAMYDGPQALAPLQRALADPKESVRIYAIRALKMRGRLEPAERFEQLRTDPNRNVRATAVAAMEWKAKEDPAALRRAWAAYDLAKMNTARVGEMAPDFALRAASGKTYALRDFRGKKAVVLRFFKLDY